MNLKIDRKTLPVKAIQVSFSFFFFPMKYETELTNGFFKVWSMAPLTCSWRGAWQNRMSQNPQWYVQMFWLGNQASHHLGHEFDGNTASELLLCFIVFHLENMGDRGWWSDSTISGSLRHRHLKMFNALKKWAKGGNEDSKLNTPLGVRAMGQALQRKFARGVQYNSKLCRLKSYID